MQSLQQRRNALVGAEERQTFDGPVARFLIGIFEMTDQDLSNPLGVNPAIAKQTQRPERPDAFGLGGGFRLAHKEVHVGRNLCQVHGGQINFDGRGAYSQIIRIQAGGDERVHLWGELEPSTPAINTGCDLVVGTVVMVDGSL